MIRIRVNGNRFFELKPASIHVSCLCPGGTLTERAQHILGQNKVDRKSFYQRPEAVAAEGMHLARYRQNHVTDSLYGVDAMPGSPMAGLRRMRP